MSVMFRQQRGRMVCSVGCCCGLRFAGRFGRTRLNLLFEVPGTSKLVRFWTAWGPHGSRISKHNFLVELTMMMAMEP